jgi:hypothetical protein
MRHGFAVTLGCLALSACGGNGDGESAGRSEVRRAIEPKAQERAESIVLALSDFPDGWRASPSAEESDEEQEAFNECLGADYSAFTLIGEANSDDFAMGEAATASSDAGVFESEEMAAHAVEERAEGLAGEEVAACVIELLGDPPGEDLEVTEAQVGELSFAAPPGVDDAMAWQLEIRIQGKAGSEAEGVSVNAYSDIVLLRHGDATVQVTTTDLPTPFDPELRDELVAAVAARMSE